MHFFFYFFDFFRFFEKNNNIKDIELDNMLEELANYDQFPEIPEIGKPITDKILDDFVINIPSNSTDAECNQLYRWYNILLTRKYKTKYNKQKKNI